MITNYHAFLLKDAKEIKGVAKNTRLLLKGDRKDDPFKETPQAMVSRVLRDLGSDKQQIIVLNDEAHHCYEDKPLQGGEKADKEQQERERGGARLVPRPAGDRQARGHQADLRPLGDAVLPRGSGYNEGYIFPWTVSDFSLMDAIESGIVKVPRMPGRRRRDRPARHLPAPVGLRRRRAPEARREGHRSTDWLPPKELEGALRSLYRSYEKAFAHWEKELAQHGETPPVFIVVCPNTVVSKLVYDWIAGRAGRRGRRGGRPQARPARAAVERRRRQAGSRGRARSSSTRRSSSPARR